MSSGNYYINDPYQKVRFHIKPQPTDVYGLRYFPNLEPEISNDQDSPPFGSGCNTEVTDCNLSIVRMAVERLGSSLKSILEIGVNRNGDRSMSRILLDERPPDSFYLGIDLDDKSYLDDESSNTWTLKCNSHDQSTVRDFLRSKGIDGLDLLMIDGWHSVNTCVNDWSYADMLRKGGIVLMHDTNFHPGPIALFEAINEDLFDKDRLCLGADHGIAVARKK